MAFTKINAAGIGSTETVTLDGLTVINDGSFGGNVSVGGTLTYEDVTNIDSVGLITARAGVVVGSGITLSKDGDIFATGVTTATTFVGDGSQLTGITGTTINNNADNRVITGSGTANTLEGEANLTWNGQTFEAYNASGPSYIVAKSNTNSGDYGIVQVQSGSTVRGRLVSDASVDAFRLDTAGRASAPITFHTGSSYTERLRIDSSGRLLLGTSTSKSAGSGQYAKLNIEGGTGTTENFVSFSRAEAASAMSAGDEVANLTFNDSAGYEFARIQVIADAATGATDTPGRIVFKTTADGASSSTERLRIDSSGRLLLGGATSSHGSSNADDLQIGANNQSNQTGITLGSASASSVRFADASDDTAGAISYQHSDDSMRFFAGSSERVRITNSGLTFNGDSAAANALDDYEEGTWTPQTHDGTVSVQYANYTKIGRQVTVVARLYNFSDNSTNDAVRIKNLPFAANVTSVAAGSAMYSYTGDANKTTLYLDSAHDGSLNLYGGMAGAFDQLRHNELNISSQQTDMYLIATYFAAS